jgi:hypothetical protein
MAVFEKAGKSAANSAARVALQTAPALLGCGMMDFSLSPTGVPASRQATKHGVARGETATSERIAFRVRFPATLPFFGAKAGIRARKS